MSCGPSEETVGESSVLVEHFAALRALDARAAEPGIPLYHRAVALRTDARPVAVGHACGEVQQEPLELLDALVLLADRPAELLDALLLLLDRLDVEDRLGRFGLAASRESSVSTSISSSSAGLSFDMSASLDCYRINLLVG